MIGEMYTNSSNPDSSFQGYDHIILMPNILYNWHFLGFGICTINPVMIKNFLKIAWRNLLKNKTYSFINIAGLAAGMAVAMIIGLWISDEVSANRDFKNYGSIYQVMMHQTFDGKRGTQTSIPFPLGEELKTKYPDLKGRGHVRLGIESFPGIRR